MDVLEQAQALKEREFLEHKVDVIKRLLNMKERVQYSSKKELETIDKQIAQAAEAKIKTDLPYVDETFEFL